MNLSPSIELPPDYKYVEKIYESKDKTIVRAMHKKGEATVVIKVTTQKHEGSNVKEKMRSKLMVERFVTDYAIQEHLFKVVESTDFLLQPIELHQYDATTAIIREDVGDDYVVLSQFLKNYELGTSKFLKLAYRLAYMVSECHKHQVLHLNLSMENILIHKDKGNLKLIGFGDSKFISIRHPYRHDISVCEDWEYVAPEFSTTGKIDHRADLYSLGCMFYEMYSQRRPIQGATFEEVAHKHATESPEPLSKCVEGCPVAINEIVMKLLEKDPNSRYQSAWSLKEDLDFCSTCLNQSSTIDPTFFPGPHELSDTFRLPDMMFGRENELKGIMQSLERVKRGKPEIIFLKGESGIGKSYLVNEACERTLDSTLLLTGNYEMNSDEPYHAVVNALKILLDVALGISTDKLNALRNYLVSQLNGFGQYLINLLPDIEELIGPQDPVSSDFYETEKRLSQSVSAFLKTFCEVSKKTIVLYINDLQYSDNNTLSLLRNLVSKGKFPCLVVASYRDLVDHPLPSFPTELRKNGIEVQEMELEPFGKDLVKKLICETFHVSESTQSAEIDELTSVLHRASSGNPFQITEFMIDLHYSNIIYFDYESKRWAVNKNKLRTVDIDYDEKSLILECMKKFGDKSRKLLQIAACSGFEFDLADIASYLQEGLFNTKQFFMESIRYGWLTEQNEIYKFSHDSLYRTSYSLLNSSLRGKVHAELGKTLLKDAESANRLRFAIFKVVDQMNLSPSILSKEERLFLSKLNLQTGKICLSVAASATGLVYLKTANSLLGEDSWEDNFDLCFDIYFTIAEIEMNSKHYEKALAVLDRMMEHAQTKIHKFKIASYALSCYNKLSSYKDGFQFILSILKENADMLFDLPINNPKKQMQWTKEIHIGLVQKVSEVLPSPETEGMKLPWIEDEEKEWFIHCLVESLPHLIFSNQEQLYTSIILVLGKWVMNNGIYGYRSSAALAAFGVTYALLVNDYKRGHIISKTGFDIARIPKFITQDNLTVCLYFYSSICHIYGDVPYCLNIYEDGFKCGRLSDNTWAGYNLFTEYILLLLTGQPMQSVLDYETYAMDYFDKRKSYFVHDVLKVFSEISNALLSSDSKFNPKLKHKNFDDLKFGRYCLALSQAIFCYFAEDYEEAYLHVETFMAYSDDATGGILEYIHPLFCTLIVSKVFYNHPEKRDDFLRLITSCYQDYFSAVNQSRIFHKGAFYLVKAEKIRCESPKNFLKVVENYKLAEAYGKSSNNPLVVALSQSRLIEYYKSCNQSSKFIAILAEEAIQQWNAIGAISMVTKLRSSYDAELQDHVQSPNLSDSFQNTSIDNLEGFSLEEILSPQDSISKILINAVRKIQQQHQPDRICFIKRNDNQEFEILSEAQGDSEPMEQTSIAEPKDIVTSVLESAFNDEKPIILNDTDIDDEFVQSRNVNAVLCTPIVQNDQCLGFYYLENSKEPFSEELATNILLMTHSELAKHSSDKGEIFARFMPTDFFNLLGKDGYNGGIIKPIEKNCTLVYTTLRRFDQYCKKFSNQETFLLLQEFVQILGPQVRDCNGFLDRLMGNSLLSFFPDNSADSAIKASISIIRILGILNTKLKRRNVNVTLAVGIGIHYSKTKIGAVGYQQRLLPTYVSEGTEIARLLQKLTKAFGIYILATKNTIGHVSERVRKTNTRPIGTFLLNNSMVLKLYEVYSMDWPLNYDKNWESFLRVFAHRKWDLASSMLQDMESSRLVRFYDKVIHFYRHLELPAKWKGEISIDENGNIYPLTENKKDEEHSKEPTIHITQREYEKLLQRFEKLEKDRELGSVPSVSSGSFSCFPFSKRKNKRIMPHEV